MNFEEEWHGAYNLSGSHQCRRLLELLMALKPEDSEKQQVAQQYQKFFARYFYGFALAKLFSAHPEKRFVDSFNDYLQWFPKILNLL